MIKRPILIALTTVPAILSSSHVSAQNVVIPTIEFAGTSAAFTIKVTTDPTQQFLIGPVVVTRDRFTLNGGVFNPLDLNVNTTPLPSINPIGQSAIDATVGKIGISSKTLFNLASGRSDFAGIASALEHRHISTSGIDRNNTALRVDNDNPISTIP